VQTPRVLQPSPLKGISPRDSRIGKDREAKYLDYGSRENFVAPKV